MTADAFIAWAMEQETGRYELEDGIVVAMAPERMAHARLKNRVLRRLEDAIAASGLACEALPDGVAVGVDDATVYEPDALVRCGGPLPGDVVKVTDPVVVVEVHSPSTGTRDTSVELVDCFRIASVRHYLQVHPGRRLVIHHARAEGAAKVETSIVRDGVLRLDPPGLDLDLDGLFEGA